MTASVWARQRDFVGLYPVCEDARTRSDRGQEGWDIGINFSTTAEFRTELDRALQAAGHQHFLQLAIAAHGSNTVDPSQPWSTARIGSFAIEGRQMPQLHIDNIRPFEQFLAYIGTRLEVNGIVYLMGCSMAGTVPGRQLLRALSVIWRGRKVVGFTQEGYQARPNQTREGGFSRCDEPGLMMGGRWADWGIPEAVVAQNNVIIRAPLRG